MQRRVLIISYDFPPSSVGIWRTLKFCRYMVNFGWRPSVLTVRAVRAPRWDEEPLRELPTGTEVRRTESLDPNRIVYVLGRARGSKPASGAVNPRATSTIGRRVLDLLRAWLFIPDDRIGWYPFALREARRWAEREKFDAVYATSWPPSALVIGERIARSLGLPFIADFRDIWIGYYQLYKPATPLHDRLQRRLESRVVRHAARVLSATEEITADFRQRYPDLDPRRFRTITNGFDPADYASHAPRTDPSVFTITYAGLLYGETSPRYFLRALRLVLRKHPEWQGRIRLRFAGGMIEKYRREIHRSGLEEFTQVDPYLAHDEALRLMQEADLLLLIVADRPGSHIMMTQKVFEYAGARRLILGLVPDGAARNFLEETGEALIAHPEDVPAIARLLLGELRRWERHGRRELPTNPALEKYERRNLTRVLCRELDVAVRGSQSR